MLTGPAGLMLTVRPGRQGAVLPRRMTITALWLGSGLGFKYLEVNHSVNIVG